MVNTDNVNREDLILKIKNAKNLIEKTTSIFYQQNKESGYIQLDGTLSLLTDVFNGILIYKMNGNEIGVDETEIVHILSEALDAMEKKDTVLLSDILQYELVDILNKVENII